MKKSEDNIEEQGVTGLIGISITEVSDEVESDLTPAKTKDWISGENGELIRLVDIGHTRKKLNLMASKYKDLVITKDNYKKEGSAAEKSLRETRYLLQNIDKQNNKYLNTVKKKVKEDFDSLIEIILGVEERLKKDIQLIETGIKNEKEEKERKENERKKKIEDSVTEWEIDLAKMLSAITDDSKLDEYDKKLNELEGSFSSFEEYEFKAKRVHSVFSGRRSEGVKVIEDAKKLESDKAMIAQEKASISAKRDKILTFRIGQLEKRGFERNKLVPGEWTLVGSNMFLLESTIIEFDEVDWTVELDLIDDNIKNKESNDEAERLKLIKESKDNWNDLIEIFKGFGGKTSLSRLSEVDVPTKEDIENLKAATLKLQAEKKKLKLDGVREEIQPWQDDFLEYISIFELKFKGAKFVHEESKSILSNLISKFESVINEVLGDINS